MRNGTKKLLLRDSKKPDGSEHIIIYIDSNGIIRSKEIKRILEERNLWIPAQPDFATQKLCVQELRLSEKAAIFAVKKYHSHHQVSEK
ncbi:28425_t:CDS:2, partial [Racocetra persica]